MTAMLLEGVFPNCESVIPKNNGVVVTLDRMEMLSAMKRVLPMTNESSNLVVLFFEEGKVTFTAENKMFGKSASETIACDCEQELKIGFKGSCLIDTLRNIEDDNIIMEMSDSMHAGVFYATTSFGREEYVSVLSPSLTN